MKNTLLKSIGATSLAILLVGGSQMCVFGQSSEKQERSIEGAWRTTVTIRNCQSAAPITTFPGLQTFNKGGTLAETATGGSPATRTPGHGVWNREEGSQNYSFVFMYDRFNADATYAGSQKVRGAVSLDATGSELTVIATTEIFNSAGQLIATGCATSTATRIE